MSWVRNKKGKGTGTQAINRLASMIEKVERQKSKDLENQEMGGALTGRVVMAKKGMKKGKGNSEERLLSYTAAKSPVIVQSAPTEFQYSGM